MVAPMIVALVLSQASVPAGETAPASEVQARPVETGATSSFQVLTLEDAVRQANERNLDLKAAQARLASANEISRKVWAGYLPQITAGGTYTYNSSEAKMALPTGYVIRDMAGTPFDPSQGPDPAPGMGSPTSLVMVPSGVRELDIMKKHQFSGQLQLTQGLIIPALWPAISNAYLAEEVAQLSVENARREVLFATVQLYYGAAGLKETVEVQQRMLASYQEHEKDAIVRTKLGASARVALLRAQIERARAEQDLRRVQMAYASAKSALATLLDREPDFEVAHPEKPAAVAASLKLEETALTDRLDVELARRNLDLAEKSDKATWYKYAPTVAFLARYQAQNAAGFSGDTDSWLAGLSLNWTLWDGGLREAEKREAAAKVAENQAMLRAAENKARDEVRRALLDLKSAEANRIKAEEQVKLARETVTLVTAGYEAGASTYLEVLDANTALQGAELSHINESLNADLAVLRLTKAAGLFNP